MLVNVYLHFLSSSLNRFFLKKFALKYYPYQTTSRMVYILLPLNYLNSQALLLPLSYQSYLIYLSNQRTIHQSIKLPKLRRYLNAMMKPMPIITGKSHYCQISTEFLRKLCIKEWQVILRNIIYYIHPNTAFVRDIRPNMQYWTSLMTSKLTWISDYFLVEYL